ncbi:MAG: hypothetical protein HUK23_06145 [Sphaerochaetaceae bacterium]|nr:hypothetical protein [Sphaerochaetaceae bacterium]
MMGLYSNSKTNDRIIPMRKAFILAILIITLLFTFTSCRTVKGPREKTATDCLYALNIVLNQTSEETISDLFLSLNSYEYSFIPTEYSFLEEKRNEIPGLDKLLLEWRNTVNSLLIENFDSFNNYADTLIKSIEFEKPIQMVNSSDSSITLLLKQTYYEDISNTIYYGINNLNLEAWNNIKIQYNAWVNTRALLFNEENPVFTEEDFLMMVSNCITDVYFNTFMKKEVFIRTTPNPDMDPVLASVLGLD